MRLNYKILTFVILLSSAFTLNSCELFEDILDDHKDSKRDNFIGVWKNDSLETKIYIDGELFQVTKQSLKGYTFEMRKDSTYTTVKPDGSENARGTWSLLADKNKYKILLDKGKYLERTYDVNIITKNKLTKSRSVNINEIVTEEHIFTYHK